MKTSRRRPSKPITKFLSPAAKTAKRKRRRLERTWKSTGLESDRIAYRKSCRETNRLINDSRRDFMRDQISEETDPKLRWRTVKHLLHSGSTDSKMSTDVCSNLCTTFSGYFVNKINNLKHSILNKLGSFTVKPQFIEQPHTGPQFESIPLVTPAEVRKLLTSIPSKSCKLDFIPTSLLKSCSDVFSELICTLANLSFAEGCFPAIFKQAIVNPLIKKPGLDKSEPSNFRPISNLNNISKLLERLFLTRFQSRISNSPNFNPLQSAYRKFHSTETSLLNTLDQVYTAADSSQPTVLVSLDLSAAFDTIDHHILLSRLQASFGVSGSAIGWISSYLTGRVQRVVVGLSQSANTSLSTGVPQGSVLGPLLFSIFTSPVGHIISSSGVRHQQYADDTQLFISLSPANLSESIKCFECCLLRLHEWFCLNGLALNPDKSEAIWLSTHQRSRTLQPYPSINVAGADVPISNKIKALDIILDNRLTFDSHVASVCASCFFHIRAFRHIRPNLTQDMAKSVAVSLISSRLDYCYSLLYGSSQANIHKLQRVQNVIAKLVCSSNARSSDALCSLEFKLRVAAPAVWNSLPLHVRQSPSFDSFKQNLKTYLFTSHD